MKLLIVGSGGREHVLAWKAQQSPRVGKVFCAPGNAGTAEIGENVAISAEDLGALYRFASQERIDLTLVGPEVPLAAGIVDEFQKRKLPIFGPSSGAARLEGSKAFAKDFMRRHEIPTARFQVFGDADSANRILKSGEFSFPLVLKADGLAAGKGVLICPDSESALEGVRRIMQEREFGAAGDRLVVEEFLTGREVSFMAFSDGRRALPMVPSEDHKALLEGDRGPNTGGMGAYSVDEILSDSLRLTILETIIHPTIAALAEEGTPFRGVLYAGLMITPDGPKVLEFNVRFGDPEAQVILPRLKSDFLEVAESVAAGDLAEIRLDWSQLAAVCVVVASGGYPGNYETDKEISGLEMAREVEGLLIFHAGSGLKDGRVVTRGGRVLGVTALAATLEEAAARAYEGVNRIHFENMYYRRDIAARRGSHGV